jgi:hypothetical protein
LYAHVKWPAVANGQVYNLTSGTKLLGNVPGSSCGSCYTGAHSHMERWGGSINGNLCCCVPCTKGSTTIYTWTIPSQCLSRPEGNK